MGVIRLLFLADTHLGFDYPFRPRVQRRRRGDDFFANFRRALRQAFEGRVDAVIHGGDLLFRSRVPARLVDMAFAPFKELADRGVPVYIVPGNHERSRIPFRLLGSHPFVHIFDSPRTYCLEKGGFRLALAGFPYWRENIRRRFSEVLESTGWRNFSSSCDGVLLCLHHCFEGATVGPGNYTFRNTEDVIRHRDVPPEVCAVLSGHIHRHQVLRQDLSGRPLRTPVLYPGSIDRTSFAEKAEAKGFLVLRIRTRSEQTPVALDWCFEELPARPMVRIRIPSEPMDNQALEFFLRRALRPLAPDSIVKLQLEGLVGSECLPLLRADSLRRLCPPEMNISLGFRTGDRSRQAGNAGVTVHSSRSPLP
jgi:DNA repair exonuclease SbcCD nuclease subunit